MGMKYDTPHDQFVIAYLPYPEQPEIVLSHAVPLAKMLKKGLILLYIEDKRYKGASVEAVEKTLCELTAKIKSEHPDTHFCALKGDSRDIIASLPKTLYGVIAVAEANVKARRRTPTHPREMLRNFAECQIAYLAAQRESDRGPYAANVALTIDYHRESKEKLIWASYFARFNKSRLHILSQDYKDEGLRRMWSDNIRFLQKIFDSLAIANYAQHQYQPRGIFPEPAAIDYSHQEGYDLFISTTTDLRDRDFVELICGTNERHIIGNPYGLPILFLNPRDDLFVLCD